MSENNGVQRPQEEAVVDVWVAFIVNCTDRGELVRLVLNKYGKKFFFLKWIPRRLLGLLLVLGLPYFPKKLWKLGTKRGMRGFGNRRVNATIYAIPYEGWQIKWARKHPGFPYPDPHVAMKQAVEMAIKSGHTWFGFGAETKGKLAQPGAVIDWVDDKKLPVTTGNKTTVYTSGLQILRTIDDTGTPRKDAKVSVIGARGSVGSALVRFLLSEGVGTIVVASTSYGGMKDFAAIVNAECGEASCVAQRNAEAAIRETDFIALVTSEARIDWDSCLSEESPKWLFEIERPRKQGKILASRRRVVFASEGPIIEFKIDGDDGDPSYHMGLDPDAVLPCFRELIASAGADDPTITTRTADFSVEELVGVGEKAMGFGAVLGPHRRDDKKVPHSEYQEFLAHFKSKKEVMGDGSAA